MAGLVDKIFRLNHDCFRFEGSVTVYTDPFHLTGKLPPAGIILISHEHFDHCSPEDIQKIADKKTLLVAPADCRSKLSGNVKIVKAGDRFEAKGVVIEVVPAYNTNKQFHPKKAGHVGYIFILDGERVYFAGDTDRIPEMKNFKVDIALLPVSGTYVMTAEEAVEAAKDINPKIVIPMHYGDIVGTADDAKRFQKLYKGACIIK